MPCLNLETTPHSLLFFLPESPAASLIFLRHEAPPAPSTASPAVAAIGARGASSAAGSWRWAGRQGAVFGGGEHGTQSNQLSRTLQKEDTSRIGHWATGSKSPIRDNENSLVFFFQRVPSALGVVHPRFCHMTHQSKLQQRPGPRCGGCLG